MRTYMKYSIEGTYRESVPEFDLITSFCFHAPLWYEDRKRKILKREGKCAERWWSEME